MMDYEKIEEMKSKLFQDFESSGAKHVEAANKFQAGLDKVIDVLLMLVLKFGRATTAQIVNMVILLACLITLVVTTVNISYLRSEVRSLMYKQEDLMKAQARIEKTASETNSKVNTTNRIVSDAVEASPKIEVNQKTGKTELVVDDRKIELKVPPKKK